jgi:hypothetical protein
MGHTPHGGQCPPDKTTRKSEVLMMNSLVIGDDSTSSKKLYLPSFALNRIPTIVLFSFLLVLVIFVVFIYNSDWQSISLLFKVSFAILLLFIICGVFAFTIYLILRRNAAFLSVRGDNLILTRKNRLKEFDIASIDFFLVVTTISILADLILHSKEFYIVDKKAKKEKIYTHDSTSPLKKSWEQTARKLGQMTGKGVVFKYYVQDLDGKVMELNEYQKQRFKRKVKIFQNPYK